MVPGVAVDLETIYFRQLEAGHSQGAYDLSGQPLANMVYVDPVADLQAPASLAAVQPSAPDDPVFRAVEDAVGEVFACGEARLAASEPLPRPLQ